MLYYLSRRRLPHVESDVARLEKKAHLIQQLKMCQAFSAVGEDVCFVSPGAKAKSWKFISEFYGLSTRFKLKTAPVLSENYNFPNYPIPDTDDQALAYWLAYMTLSNKFEKGDVIYSRNFNPTRYFLLFLKWAGIEADVSVWFEQHQVDRGADAGFYEQLDGVVCVSHNQKQRMVDTLPVEDEQLFVAHDGVDLGAYQGISTEQARRHLGLPQDEQIVMYTGHLYPSKDVETLLQAATDFDAHCYIVGGTDEDIERINSECAVPETVTFTGFVPPAEIPLYQMSADVLVATVADDTGDHEFFSPLKIFEYMATGKPLVVSRKPAYGEILTHGENSLLIEPESPGELRRSVERLLSEPDLAERLGRQARTDSQQYGWETRARRILDELYRTADDRAPAVASSADDRSVGASGSNS